MGDEVKGCMDARMRTDVGDHMMNRNTRQSVKQLCELINTYGMYI